MSEKEIPFKGPVYEAAIDGLREATSLVKEAATYWDANIREVKDLREGTIKEAKYHFKEADRALKEATIRMAKVFHPLEGKQLTEPVRAATNYFKEAEMKVKEAHQFYEAKVSPIPLEGKVGDVKEAPATTFKEAQIKIKEAFTVLNNVFSPLEGKKQTMK